MELAESNVVAAYSNKKFKRSENFTFEEKLLFIRILKKYSNIVENKETDKVGLKDKNDAWSKIEKEFNETEESPIKTQKQLQNLWSTLKKIARKKYASLKRETYLTGGGSCKVKIDVISEKVYEIIGTSISGILYEHDSDLQLENTVIDNNENKDPNNNANDLDNNLSASDDPDDPDDPVFEHLVKNGEIENWSNWNPSKLKKPVSLPLSEAINGGSSHNLGSIKNSSIRKVNNSKNISSMLLKSKLELAIIMKNHMVEKTIMEKKIMTAELKRKDLEVKLLEIEVEERLKSKKPFKYSMEQDEC
ncbi:fibrinogen silencer-binding protein-like [Prorops nasuta]|uniref:fibrinogen silencer-binding protein-like n=1 Tax=Prorops nasuta TaxID=863751 RepID=UPI0034CDBD52